MKKLTKNLAKRKISKILYKSKLLDKIVKKYYSNKAVILLYHRVLDENQKANYIIQPGMYVKKSTFDMHLKTLKKYFQIIKLDELIYKIANKQDIGNYCCITFDDGWIDNYLNSFSTIRKYRSPVTIFLATGYIGTKKWFWPEILSNFVISVNENEYSKKYISPRLKNLVDEMVSKKYLSKIEINEKIVNYFKKLSNNTRDSIIQEIRNIHKNDIENERLLMDWDEISDLHKSKIITFGSHSVNHVLLDQIDIFNQKYELEKSKEVIENKLEITCPFFAYPNGNYNKSIKEKIKDYRYQAAFTTKRDFIRKNIDLFEMPRIGMHEDVSNCPELLLWRLLIK